MHQAFEEFKKVTAVLSDDVQHATELHASNPSDFTRRLLVKTWFTYLEGHLYAFKQNVLSFESVLSPWGNALPFDSSRIVLFTPAERAMLKEQTYELRGATADEASARIRFDDNFKFLVAVFHKAIRLESKVEFNCTGWNRIKTSQSIRNRLTHPKSAEDLAVTEQELAMVGEAVNWYDDVVQQMLDRLEHDSMFSVRFKSSGSVKTGTSSIENALQQKLLSVIERQGCAVVTVKQYHEIFPGGEPENPNKPYEGESHLAQALRFMNTNRVSSRSVKAKVIYWRGRIIIDNLVSAIEEGEQVVLFDGTFG